MNDKTCNGCIYEDTDDESCSDCSVGSDECCSCHFNSPCAVCLNDHYTEIKENNMFEDAKIGDTIWSERFGPCKVINIYKEEHPIELVTERGYKKSCTICGREYKEDVKPSYFWSEPKYEIPPRPKRIVKKTLEGWVNIYPDGPSFSFHTSREEADNLAGSDRIACAELTGPYEVEE